MSKVRKRRWCPKCGITKHITGFYPNRCLTSRARFSVYCRPCSSVYADEARTRLKNRPPKKSRDDGFKRCSKCRRNLPETSFSKNGAMLDRLHGQCKECTKPSQQDRYLRMRYGITLTEYRSMLEAQKHVCYLCKKPETLFHMGRTARLSVDHDHGTGKPRSLLCNRCNISVGGLDYLKRNGLVSKALQYVRCSRPRTETKSNLGSR